jgi:hypothetical protein
MEKLNLISSLVFSLAQITPVTAQVAKSPLDNYLETGKTIVIGRCLAIGPIDILMRARAEIEILQVVKGKETLRKVSVLSQYGMSVGETYLLRTENEATEDGRYFEITNRDSVVEIGRGEDMALLKTLSPQIIVLRIMNMRMYRLESDLRRLTYENDALKAVTKGN